MGRKKSSRVTSKTVKDPFAKREANNYANPIPSREYIMQYLADAGKLLSYQQLAESFELTDDEQLTGLRYRLRAMERDGQLHRNRRGAYGLVSKLNLQQGVVQGHKDGYGFVKLEEHDGDDLYLNPRQMRQVFDGDRVLVRATAGARGKKEAVVIEVLSRKHQQVVGRLFQEGGICFLHPDNKRINQDILIPPEETAGAIAGQMVVVEILAPLNFKRQPHGRVVKVLGEAMAPGMEVDVAIHNHDIPNAWPQAVLAEIENIKPRVAAADKVGRRDCRELPFVTIDGEDAKDFDDAVYCKKRGNNGYTLFVAIADVAHYVKVDSALDASAFERGTSVYFPGQVVPMLPEILSNGLCSLKPKVDRLAMMCEMRLSNTGRVESYRFYNAVIRSHARLTYRQVHEMIQGTSSRLRQKVWPWLEPLYTVFLLLRKKRQQRGMIEFEFPEPRIIFDKQRKIEKIVAYERYESHKLIEECMLLANVCTAQYLLQKSVPALYRNHLGPRDERLQELRGFLKEIGLKLQGGKKPQPSHVSAVLQQATTRDDSHMIETVILRSMQQAVYERENLGHFGLAFEAYTHFTSPIRRYPDLMVHRAIKFIIDKRRKKQFNYSDEDLDAIAEHCCQTERRAEEASRDVIAWLKCEFMRHHLGEIYPGKIVAVTAFGIFVQLDQFFIEGLVHVTALPNDYYRYDPLHHCLQGERSAKRYRIGDMLNIRVARVNLDDKKIDFDLV